MIIFWVIYGNRVRCKAIYPSLKLRKDISLASLVLTTFYIVFMLGFYTQIRWRRYGNVGTWKFTFKIGSKCLLNGLCLASEKCQIWKNKLSLEKTKTKPTLKNMNKKLHKIQDEIESRDSHLISRPFMVVYSFLETTELW